MIIQPGFTKVNSPNKSKAEVLLRSVLSSPRTGAFMVAIVQ